MAMNRIQFQPGLSMPEFLKRYGTEAQCTGEPTRCFSAKSVGIRPR